MSLAADDEREGLPEAAGAKADRAFVVALSKGMHILEAFTPEVKWLGNAELSERASIPKPTVSRFTKALTAMGYLYYSTSRRQYRLGYRVLALGYAGHSGNGISEVVRPHLQSLADEFNLHAALVGRDGTNVVHLEVSHSANTFMTLRLETGSRIPLAGTASGYALLSRIPSEERNYLFGYLKKRHERHWSNLATMIRAGIAEVEAKGYATSRDGWLTDINGVAVPIVPMGGSPVLAISCGAPSHHLPLDKLAIVGERLVSVAAKVMDAMARHRGDFAQTESGSTHPTSRNDREDRRSSS